MVEGRTAVQSSAEPEPDPESEEEFKLRTIPKSTKIEHRSHKNRHYADIARISQHAQKAKVSRQQHIIT